MNKIVVVDEKKLISGIVKAFNKMDSAKKGYVNSVIEFGEKLIETKKQIPHGGWEKFCENSLKNAFKSLPGGGISSEQQAHKFMKIAANKSLVLEFFNDENSINSLSKAITDATPEQLERAKEIEAEKIQAAELKSLAKTKVPASIVVEDNVIEGEFTEVKPEVVVPVAPIAVESELKVEEEPEPIESQLNGIIDDQQAVIAELQADNESLVKVFESDDKLATALKELKQVKEMNRVLEERLRGVQNERNEAVKSAKYWKNKFEKLEKDAKVQGAA
jgi:hypothetical protein